MNLLRCTELTPVGRGAVSVLSLEGPGALERVRRWSARALTPGGLFLARLSVDGEELDEVLLTVFSEERVEIHLHGSPPLVEALCASVGRGGRPESLEARALQALAGAPGEEGARILLDQGEGALRAELVRLLEEGEPAFFAGLGELAETSARARPALEPTRVVLAGEANAGKSTLFNLLVSAERVITSPEAGTTRDTISEPALLGVWPVVLVDTAGNRAVEGEDETARLERAAGRLAERARASADLVLWLRPPGAPAPPPARGGERRVVLLAKCDLLAGGHESGISVVSDPEHARGVVERVFREALELPERIWRSGRAVAFDAHSREAIEAARSSAYGTAREKVNALLEEGVQED